MFKQLLKSIMDKANKVAQAILPNPSEAPMASPQPRIPQQQQIQQPVQTQPQSISPTVVQNTGLNPSDPNTWKDLIIPVKLDENTGFPRIMYEEAKAIQDYFLSNKENPNPLSPPIYDANREKEGIKRAYLSQIADSQMGEVASFNWLSRALNVNVIEEEDYGKTKEQAAQESMLIEQQKAKQEQEQSARIGNPVVQSFLETSNGQKLLDIFRSKYGDSDALEYAGEAIFDALGPPESKKRGGNKMDRRIEFFIFNPEYLPEEAKSLIEQSGFNIENAQSANTGSVKEKSAIIDLLSNSPFANNLFQMLDFLATEGDDSVYNHIMSSARRGVTWKGRGKADKAVSMQGLSGDPEKTRELGGTEVEQLSELREEGMESKLNRIEKAKEFTTQSMAGLKDLGTDVIESIRQYERESKKPIDIKMTGESVGFSVADMMEMVLNGLDNQVGYLLNPENERVQDKAEARGVSTSFKKGRPTINFDVDPVTGEIKRDISKIFDAQIFSQYKENFINRKKQIHKAKEGLVGKAPLSEDQIINLSNQISSNLGEDPNFIKETLEEGPRAISSYNKIKPANVKTNIGHRWSSIIGILDNLVKEKKYDNQSVSDFLNLFGVHGSFLQPFTDSDYQALQQVPGWQEMPVNDIIRNMMQNGYISELTKNYNIKKPGAKKTEDQIADLVKKRLLGNKTSFKNTETLWNLKGEMPEHIQEWLNWRKGTSKPRLASEIMEEARENRLMSLAVKIAMLNRKLNKISRS